ncbi:hypothetical protein CP532_4605 [Ophiocordyceps camponoti-leonardi (nom. inval.)]|nr:hypothetical protein CP532_4605 [Ophiocordyceps camponoti-leonardi (nom. inval.)]
MAPSVSSTTTTSAFGSAVFALFVVICVGLGVAMGSRGNRLRGLPGNIDGSFECHLSWTFLIVRGSESSQFITLARVLAASYCSSTLRTTLTMGFSSSSSTTVRKLPSLTPIYHQSLVPDTPAAPKHTQFG